VHSKARCHEFLVVLFLAVAVVVFTAGPGADAASADANARCLACHQNQGLAVNRDGRKVSLYVDPGVFSSSVHGKLPCVSCHPDFASVPHDKAAAGVELRDPEVCLGCHDEIRPSYEYSFHGTAFKHGYSRAASCSDCHGAHNILGPDHPDSSVHEANIPNTCRQCHIGKGNKLAQGKEHKVPQDPESSFPLYVVWKFFMALIVFDTLKDGPIVILELVKRLKVALRTVTAERRGRDRDG